MEYTNNDGPSGIVSGGSGITEPFFSSYEEIGHGTTHVLYKARRYGRWYVLKGLNKELQGNALYEEWLYKEYSIGVQFDHPNIIRIESLEDNIVAGKCIVMEYVEGETLDRWLQHKHSLSERKTVLSQLLDAVNHCHSRNLYHHDLKPSNILVTNDNRVKLIDFGLSDGPQYAAFKQATGTEGFAAPEQVKGDTADQRADIYALGRLIEMIVPHRYRRAVRMARQTNPEHRQPSVDVLRRTLRSRWWICMLPLLIAILLTAFFVIPLPRIHSTQLDSGQTLYYRILENFPHRRAVIVFPENLYDPLAADVPKLHGDIVIPETIKVHGLRYRITEIGERAFANQFFITSIVLPESLEKIHQGAFEACTGLADTLVIPRSLTYIGPNAFNDCFRLTTVVWQADSCEYNIRNVDYYFFYRCSSLRTVIMTPNVRKIPECLFRKADSLRTVVFSDGIETIPFNIFSFCNNLDSIRFPQALRTIEHGAFYTIGAHSLRFPESTEIISNYAFSCKHNIRRIDFGSKLQYIGNHAFSECWQLEEVTLRATIPPEVQRTSFDEMPATAVLRVPKESIEAYKADSIWSKFDEILPL